MNTEKTIIKARAHVADNPQAEDSARLCLRDAVSCYDAGDMEGARRRALKSLDYSLGIGHRSQGRGNQGEEKDMEFKDVKINEGFDFVGPDRVINSFFKRVWKVSARRYVDGEGRYYRVGTVHAKVYHADREQAK